ncbi:NAD(P)H-binding protein [Panacagrimonas sp.]|uniref:NmrA family NAD(P)-binding protein n=1 Tax=Panacagrimonas sp. TaxID=2480088 RepID=UPI003B51EEF5
MYVLMGSNGNITSKAVRALHQSGVPVRVIGRSAASLAPLHQLDAELAVGDARDAGFLTQAFAGATAVYVMIPTDYGAPDLRRAQAELGRSIATAIAQSGVRRVVNLSSIGGELPAGTGPIVGLHEEEQRLDAIPNLELLHLRPGYFMENHLLAASTIASLGVYPSLERSDIGVPMVATPDIATIVVRELLDAKTCGVLHLHAPRHYTFQQAATILGRAIGRPDLMYVQSDVAEARTAMLHAGFSPDAAEQMAEMAQWLSTGTHSTPPEPVEVMPTTLEDFAPRFRAAYEALERAEA